VPALRHRHVEGQANGSGQARGKRVEVDHIGGRPATFARLLENSPNQCPAIPSRARDTNDTNSTATRHRHDTDRTYHGCYRMRGP
jgi:hypothetical protein